MLHQEQYTESFLNHENHTDYDSDTGNGGAIPKSDVTSVFGFCMRNPLLQLEFGTSGYFTNRIS